MAVSNRTAWAIVLAVLAGLVMLSHGWSLDAGLYLDDHSHYAQLRESGWGYQDMVGACRLGIIGRVMHTWFREETGLRFYRPVAFWLMKLQYTLVGWRPVGAHAFSLLWHMAAATLVYILAYKCIGRRFWAGLAASVFAAHPGNILTVYWVACQTELMVVSFILVSFLCYCRYSNWPTPMFAEWSRIAGGPIAPGGQTIWLIGSLVFFALALGCRENAVVLPVLAVAGDLLLRPRQWRRRIMAYVLFAVVFAIYFHLRSKALGGFPMPTRPYMVPPSDPEFFSFIVEKFVYYFLGLFALFPVLPIGGQIYFRENPTLFYVTFVVLLAFWTAWLVLMRRHRGLLLAPLWVVLGMAPVIAVFASGHHLYLPSIGAVLMVAALWAWLLGDCFGRPKLPPGWIRKTVIVVAVAVHLVLLPGACWAFGWVYRTSTEVEDLVIDDVVKHTPDLRDGDKLFFINLSMMAYYAVPAMEDLTGAKHLRGYVLTFSPKLLMMEEPCRVTQLDDRSFSVELERDGYFRGAMGQVLREIMGRSEFFKPGERISSDEFDTIIAETGEEGVRKLVFRFHRPLNSPGYHFYLGSRLRPAYLLTWDGPTSHPTTGKR